MTRLHFCVDCFMKSVPTLYIQGVSKIHGINSGMGSSYVDNKNSLYQPRSGNA
jgi:hypothetical protein